ncbi:membrane protein [Bacillus coahuilensis m2-6]|uniref:Membrane protein n=1 Tax=Bacillus coahuilensis p1.1.43 TaxID=1150625 RepID=A0A147K7K5_9BACI|nr:DUF456 family protein [Bacillus coahuilensis]KUP05994.1 membrane protein [Bacillus coahuilensis p1.1.43]KUP07209.1 membrane protein [Bacillus coahuilensis m2-6]
MEIIYWFVVGALFIISFVGLIYPIIPSVVFLVGGFIAYGFLFSFEPFGPLFWTIQGLLFVLLFAADYLANYVGLKKFGGSRAGVWGSTIGILIGPFVIPVFGIIIGPFLGAFLGELLFNKRSVKDAGMAGVGSVVGFVSSVVTKGFLQFIMILYFFIIVL